MSMRKQRTNIHALFQGICAQEPRQSGTYGFLSRSNELQ